MIMKGKVYQTVGCSGSVFQY